MTDALKREMGNAGKKDKKNKGEKTMYPWS